MKPAVTGLALLLALSWAGAGRAQPAGSPYEQVVADLLRSLTEITQALKAIDGEAAADAARPKLKAAAARFAEVREQAGKMKQPDMQERDRVINEYQKKMADTFNELRSEVRRVRTIPGGPEALQELAPLSPRRPEEPKGDDKTTK